MIDSQIHYFHFRIGQTSLVQPLLKRINLQVLKRVMRIHLRMCQSQSLIQNQRKIQPKHSFAHAQVVSLNPLIVQTLIIQTSFKMSKPRYQFKPRLRCKPRSLVKPRSPFLNSLSCCQLALMTLRPRYPLCNPCRCRIRSSTRTNFVRSSGNVSKVLTTEHKSSTGSKTSTRPRP